MHDLNVRMSLEHLYTRTKGKATNRQRPLLIYDLRPVLLEPDSNLLETRPDSRLFAPTTPVQSSVASAPHLAVCRLRARLHFSLWK